jgi:hypothetical protein
MKTRQDQYDEFNFMVARLLTFALDQRIPIRIAEAHRPAFVAEKYAKEGLGIIDSKHRYSLAVDIWVTSKTGLDIDYRSPEYETLGSYWKDLGGTWGGSWKRRDSVHFEYAEKPLKK